MLCNECDYDNGYFPDLYFNNSTKYCDIIIDVRYYV